MTQTLWQRKPNCMRISVGGTFGPGVSAKDLALHITAMIGTGGAQGHAIEYAGAAIDDLAMEGRLTLCNMSIEAGARCAMVAPDERTIAFVRDRAYSPTGAQLDAAIAHWRTLASDANAHFHRELQIDARAIEPMVTWGVSPQDALPITASIPDTAPPETLAYMGLARGQALADVAVDRVFIGSCTNGRLDDLRSAARILRGRKARVPGLVSPGSSAVKRAAEAEGLDKIFLAAGLSWVESGCSMCVGMNGDVVGAGERCASTTNRNFRGRQGIGARTHLMSPAMVAAAAVTGRLADVRTLAQLQD
jgi:3-isopropylmalate/(R)-2-methylmalate dehydratase large subunit